MPTLEYARLFPSVVLPTALGTRLPPDEIRDQQHGGGPDRAVALPIKGEYLIRDVVALAALAPAAHDGLCPMRPRQESIGRCKFPILQQTRSIGGPLEGTGIACLVSGVLDFLKSYFSFFNFI